MSRVDAVSVNQSDVRTRLMRAAEHLLASSADGHISTREVCSGARVTPPTLYHHFKDKHALLDAVVLEGFTSYLEGKRAILPSGDVLNDFRTGWDMHVSFGCENPAHYRLMFGNPQADQIAPAAVVARDEVARAVDEWGIMGHLKVSTEVAMATMSTAAVGVTLQLIAARADATHPISTNVRDTIAGSLFRAVDSEEAPAEGIPRSARMLLERLPGGSLEPLRATEVALLREWLEFLATTTQIKKLRRKS